MSDKITVHFEVSITEEEEEVRSAKGAGAFRQGWVHSAIKELYLWTMFKERIGPLDIRNDIPADLMQLLTERHVDISWWLADDIGRLPDNYSLSDEDTIRKVTCWYKFNQKTQGYHFNHIEYGWSGERKPTPKSKAQKDWSKSLWISEYAYINFKQEVVHEWGTNPTVLPIKNYR